MSCSSKIDRLVLLKGDDPPVISSEALFGKTRELTIQHGAELYRLRLTASNKLILIK
ncbi:MAG: hemin uptake protein HemP [Rhizobiales bacterium]|nr:hemin uptake protein HemP [Hyphomicrobiales bacterium]